MVSPATSPQLRALLLCELADDPAPEGADEAARVVRAHDALVRRLLQRFGGEEIDRADGFLLVFDHPIRAAAFALAYQRALREGPEGGPALAGRVGIHVGDVRVWASAPEDVARGAKPVNVEGLAKPIAARLMRLAPPGRILLSGVAAALARRSETELEALGLRVRWQEHGVYRFQGVAEPVPVHELGEAVGRAPGAPASAEKARRVLPWWRRRPLRGAAAVALLALAVLIARWAGGEDESLAFAQRDWIVIGSLDNKTGDPRLNQTLETALRIAIEQSPHVNVIPRARTASGLERMGLAAETEVDRVVGSELAIREGARALVLPSALALGARLQISLEVVDPQSQHTVYVEVADGSGPDAAFEALDRVGVQLRKRLGEAVQSIERFDAPLAQAATRSLDALRAYSLGLAAQARQDLRHAEQLHRQAVELDPEFAAAYVALARLRIGLFDRVGARHWLRKAYEFRDRLSERERQHFEGWVMWLDHQPGFVDRWRGLLELYPDYHEVSHDLALASWYGNDYEMAAAQWARASAPQSVTRPISTYNWGIPLLALGRVDQALERFKAAELLGITGVGVIAAAGHAVRRDFDAAREVLRQVEPGKQAVDRARAVMSLAIAVDAGDEAAIARQIAILDEDIAKADPISNLVSRASVLAARAAEDPGATTGAAQALIAAAREAEGVLDETIDRETAALTKLVAAYWLARQQADPQVDRVLAESRAIAEASPYPVLADMRRLVGAQALLREGRHEEAIETVRPMLDGDEMYLAHAVLMEAHLGAGHGELAAQQARWLEGHRGRAYAEWAYRRQTLVANIIASRNARVLLESAAVEAS